MMVVPVKWMGDKTVYWPPNSLVSLSRDPLSTPDMSSWTVSMAKELGRATTYAEAEAIMVDLLKITDSEDAETIGTRTKSAKKNKKFKCNSYNLTPVPVRQAMKQV